LACGGEVTKLIVDLEDRMEKKFVLMGTESRTTLMQMLGEQRVRIDKEDSWVWKDKESTVLTVKSVYHFLKQGVQGAKKEMYGDFWRLKAQPPFHLTSWRVLEDKIASKANLAREGLCISTIMCCLCGEEEETTSHLFCTCRVAWLVWSMCYEWMRVAATNHREPKKHYEGFRMNEVKESVN